MFIKLAIALLRLFALFLLGLSIVFLILAMFDSISLLFAYLPIIWGILWRSGLGLMMITAIALFIESLNNGTKEYF